MSNDNYKPYSLALYKEIVNGRTIAGRKSFTRKAVSPDVTPPEAFTQVRDGELFVMDGTKFVIED